MDTTPKEEPVWITAPIMETDKKEKRPPQVGSVVPKPYLKCVLSFQVICACSVASHHHSNHYLALSAT